MRHGQRLTLQELRDETDRLMKEGRWGRKAVADELGISPGAVSTALNNVDSAYANVLIKILQHISDYSAEKVCEYEISRKGK